MIVGQRWSGYYDGWTGAIRVLLWLGCGGEGTTVVGTVFVRVLRWLDCGCQDITMVGLQWSGYYDGWTVLARVLRWFDCGGQGTTIVGLQW